MIIGRLVSYIKACLLRTLSPLVTDVLYSGFWNFRDKCIHKLNGKECIKSRKSYIYIYDYLCSKNCAFIGRGATFKSNPILPHGLHGIHISNGAMIGENVVIFQQVTIGSNTLAGHPRLGSPTIGDNVYIGAGAKIIGNVTIGNNCRIGANAVVVKDIADNCTVVAAPIRVLSRNNIQNNVFVPHTV